MKNRDYFRFSKREIAARLNRGPAGNNDSLDTWRPVLAALSDDQMIDLDTVIDSVTPGPGGVLWILAQRPKNEIAALIIAFLNSGIACEYTSAAISLLERLHRGALHPHEQQTDFPGLATQAEAAARRMGEKADFQQWRGSPLRAVEAAMGLNLIECAHHAAETRVPLEIRAEGLGRINAFRQAWTGDVLRSWFDSDYVAPTAYRAPRPAPAGPSAAQVDAVHMEIRRRKLANLSDEALVALLEDDDALGRI